MSPALIEWMKRSTVEIAAASSALTRNASLDGEGLALAATALWLGTGLEVSAPDGRVVGGDEVVITSVGVGAGGLAHAPPNRLATMATAIRGKRMCCPRAAIRTTFYTRLTSGAGPRSANRLNAPRRGFVA